MVAIQSAIQDRPPIAQNGQKRITWVEFQKRYLDREDGFKYEWVDGYVEKTRRNMDKKQLYIVTNLQRFFSLLYAQARVSGWLLAEGDTFFGKNHRRPDVAYYNDEQLIAARTGGKAEPQFIIEIISSNDQMHDVHRKMRDYNAVSIPVVWHIFTEIEEVHVYNGRVMKVLIGDELCSAAPVLPEFQISVNDIFK